MIGSLGIWEILFILGLALLIFGPRKLPEIGRTLGRGMAEFRRASTELTRTLNAEVAEDEQRTNKASRSADEGKTGARTAQPDRELPAESAASIETPADTTEANPTPAVTALSPADTVPRSSGTGAEATAAASEDAEAKAETS